MIDTIILNIPSGSYKVRPETFTPNANILLGSGNYLVKCVNNPTAADKKDGLYRPRMTLVKRMTKNGNNIPLKIEFSVAKMLYGNNVDEAEEEDFERVVENLHIAMREMGALVEREVLKNAKVSAFHPSKNIELTSGYTSSFVITELHKLGVTKKMDLNRDSFRNNGRSLQYYTNSHSFVFYDKVYDTQKPEKRAMDKDQNSLQLSIFDAIPVKEMKEILRIEVRLAKKVKMNAVLKCFGFDQNPTFKDVFKKGVCQKMLRTYWSELVTDRNLFLFDVESSAKKTLERIFKNRPNMKPKEAFRLVGLWALSREGIRDARAVVEKHSSSRSWYRIAEDLPFLDDISSKIHHDWLRQINEALTEFVAYKLNKK